MARADLTTAEHGKLPGAYRRRRVLAAMFGLFALVLQTGFSLGTTVGAGAAEPGSLAADLAVLCMDGSSGSGGGTDDNSGACDHCRLCGPALTLLPPDIVPGGIETAAAAPARLPERVASLRLFAPSGYPRAPPA